MLIRTIEDCTAQSGKEGAMARIPAERGIVIGVDGSAESRAAIAWGAREAFLHRRIITLLHVVESVVGEPAATEQGGAAAWQDHNAHDVIAQALDDVSAAFDGPLPLQVQTKVLHANAKLAFIDVSKHADMLVVGSIGRNALGRVLLGSVSSGVVHHAHCPAAIVHVDEDTRIDPDAPILLGIDGSPVSEAATEWAFDEASRRQVPLVALHAWSDVAVFPILGMNWRTYRDRGEELLGERLAGWQEKYPDVQVARKLMCDKPARWLLEESQHSQMVVVGRHGRGGFSAKLVGSVSWALAQAAKVPVIVIDS